MRALDGHVFRSLEGKTIRYALKDGVYLILEMTNGELWRVAFADAEGEPLPGEPSIVRVGKLELSSTSRHQTLDGHVNRRLSGKTIEAARTDGEVLYFDLVGGEQYGVAWADPARTDRVHGEPCLCRIDVQVTLPGISITGRATDI